MSNSPRRDIPASVSLKFERAWNTDMRAMEWALSDYVRDNDLPWDDETNVLRMVGGCVRDIVRDETPKDYDFCTPLTPDHVMKALKRAFEQGTSHVRPRRYGIIPTGLQHGTITVVFPDTKQQYEITTLRADVKTDGRHAEVAFVTNFTIDAERRDFTMNSMSTDSTGDLYDYFSGYEDALAGRVRFVGDPWTRIAEDYLRILRFYRFSARMGVLSMDHITSAALQAGMHKLSSISGERIWAELSKILATPNSGFILEQLRTAQFFENGLGLPGELIGRKTFEDLLIERLRKEGLSPICMFWAWLVHCNFRIIDETDISDVPCLLNVRLHLSSAELDQIKGLVKVMRGALKHETLEYRVMVQDISLSDARNAMVIHGFRCRPADELNGFNMDWIPPEFPVRGADLIHKTN